MAGIASDPSLLTKDRLKSELQAHKISLPSGDARKDAYVKLYLKHLTPLAKKNKDSQRRSEFSSDEESSSVGASNRKKTPKKSSSRVITRDDVEIEKDIAHLTDKELSDALQALGATIGPITATTRSVYERKLIKLQRIEAGEEEVKVEESDEYSDSEDEDVTSKESSQESQEIERSPAGVRKRVQKSSTYTERVTRQEKRDSPAKKKQTKKVESFKQEKTVTVVENAVKETKKQTTTTEVKKKQYIPVFVQIGILVIVAVLIFLILYNMESLPKKTLEVTNNP